MGCSASTPKREAPPGPPRSRTAQPNIRPQSRQQPIAPSPARAGYSRPVSRQRSRVPSPTRNRRPVSHSGSRQIRLPSPTRQRPQSSDAYRRSRPSGALPRPETEAGWRQRHGAVSQVIPEDYALQSAEDAKIVFDFQTLGTYILNHALNFYQRNYLSTVRYYIAHTIISSIVLNNSNDLGWTSSELYTKLQDYATDTFGGRRRDHLDALCKLGACLRDSIATHPAEWSFGPWSRVGVRVVYPSLLKNGGEVVPGEVVKER